MKTKDEIEKRIKELEQVKKDMESYRSEKELPEHEYENIANDIRGLRIEIATLRWVLTAQ